MSPWPAVALDLLVGGATAVAVGTGAVPWGGLVGSTVGLYLTGLSRPSALAQRSGRRRRLVATGIAAVFSGFWAAETDPSDSAHTAVAVQALALFAVCVGWRAIYMLQRSRHPRLPLVLVGGGTRAHDLLDRPRGLVDGRVEIVAFVPLDESARSFPVPIHRGLKGLAALCRQLGTRTVLVELDRNLDPTEAAALAGLAEHGVRVTTTSELSEAGVLATHSLPHRWTVDVVGRISRPGAAAAKRALDLAIASVGLACLAAMLPLLWLVTRLDSPGPLFFTQPRVGRAGRTFRIYKIRTMSSAPGGAWTAAADPRITRIGRLLRRTRIDELPQFYNVLRGEMSVVGPRPEQPALASELQARIPTYGYRHLVRPGITGWAQINCGYAGSVDESIDKLSYDLFYVEHHGVLIDLGILLRTGFVMLAGIGAR